jgi:acetyl-CoA acetyltransferase
VPDAYISMLETAEVVARRYGIPASAGCLWLASQQRAAARRPRAL